MRWVLDSSALVYLGKLRILERMLFLGALWVVPHEVYREVVERGIERGESEAEHIRTLIEQKKLIVRNGKAQELALFEEIPFLSIADKEVLALSRELHCTALIDEKHARGVAELFHLEYHGVIYFILKLLELKKITKKEALFYLDKLLRPGFYFSREKYRDVLGVIEKLSKK